jgi:hypothetical protein
MQPLGSEDYSGTTMWNVWKWDAVSPPTGRLYDGQATTIQAGIRLFSLNNDGGPMGHRPGPAIAC